MAEHLAAVPQIQFLGAESASIKRARAARDLMLRTQWVERRTQIAFSLSMGVILVTSILVVIGLTTLEQMLAQVAQKMSICDAEDGYFFGKNLSNIDSFRNGGTGIVIGCFARSAKGREIHGHTRTGNLVPHALLIWHYIHFKISHRRCRLIPICVFSCFLGKALRLIGVSKFTCVVVQRAALQDSAEVTEWKEQ